MRGARPALAPPASARDAAVTATNRAELRCWSQSANNRETRRQAWHRSCIYPPAGTSRRIWGADPMSVPTNELLLALRSPTSGWLAAMVCALEEAVQDPSFSEHHRNLVRQLLDADKIPTPVATAANDRLVRFEQAVSEMHGLLTNSSDDVEPAAPIQQRPKLTLVGSVAA